MKKLVAIVCVELLVLVSLYVYALTGGISSSWSFKDVVTFVAASSADTDGDGICDGSVDVDYPNCEDAYVEQRWNWQHWYQSCETFFGDNEVSCTSVDFCKWEEWGECKSKDYMIPSCEDNQACYDLECMFDEWGNCRDNFTYLCSFHTESQCGNQALGATRICKWLNEECVYRGSEAINDECSQLSLSECTPTISGDICASNNACSVIRGCRAYNEWPLCETHSDMESCEAKEYCNWDGYSCKPDYAIISQCSEYENDIDECTAREFCTFYVPDTSSNTLDCRYCTGGPDLCPSEDASGLDANEDGCIDDIQGLSQVINTFPDEELSSQTRNSLESKVASAQKSLGKGKDRPAINKLQAFINQVNAQRGKKISEEAADLLIEYANNVISQIQAE